ncbi:MAG: hypothetical protein IH878_11920 [Gemmatimonadetes bacterium]|nr:hypothetical protein [Gemmatimonadota bacterium]
MSDVESLKRRLQREREARKQAETIAEEKTRELFVANRALKRLNQQLEERVRERTAELAASRDQAMEASRAKTQFLANMSHEFRTPMNAIIGFTRLAMRRSRDLLPEGQYKNLEKILISSEHLLSLINSVLDLSKVQAGQMEVHPVDFALEPLVDMCLRTVEPMVKTERVQLEKRVEPDLPRLFTDPEKLKQILVNLLSNAVKFTEEGRITVAIRHTDEELAIAVSDTGTGIPEDKLGVIFEGFRQVDSSTTRKYGGAGLGLSISHHLARLMGGDITVESTVSVGSTFTVTFPLRYAAVA